MELCQGRAGGWGKALHQRAVGMERPAQGSRHGTELLELTELLDIALSLGLGGAVCGQAVVSVIPVGSFQLRIFCVSLILSLVFEALCRRVF